MACEVIPEMAHETGMDSRCLRWTFSRPTTDLATLFQRSVVSLVPSPEETGTSYYPSMQLNSGAQSVRFVPPRKGNEKKMLANAASYCSSSAAEVVGPSARGTRAARTLHKGPQASRALRDESNDEIPVVDQAIERAIASLRREQGSAPSHRSAGPSRRSPTLDIGDQSLEPSEHSALRRPLHLSRVLDTPVNLMNAHDDAILTRACTRFRGLDPGANILILVNDMHLWQGWFDELEDLTKEIHEQALSYFLTATSRRVRRDPKCRTVVAATGLYAFVIEWKRLHPLDPDCLQTYEDDDYRRWIPPVRLIHWILGSDVRYQMSWLGRDYAIVVCNILTQHWVVVRIRLTNWVVELYDSFLFHMDDPSDPVLYKRRDRELMPLLCLLPRLLLCAGFWQGRRMPPRCAFAMTLDWTIPDQYMQTDGTSCGVYVCMYADCLLGGGPPLGVPEEQVHTYQRTIVARIYSLNYTDRLTT
ncbi:hypothetical protein C2S52_016236 [Perilla frutescens var. hirtella]|nr:hypothetical protein C2S52_016236 [Perilla frutescens var. hirtella]